jgi:uncharacterized membrane protein
MEKRTFGRFSKRLFHRTVGPHQPGFGTTSDERKKMSTKIIKNYFYLIAGILAILFSFTHAWNGQISILPLVEKSSLDLNMKTTFFYVWHIITSENLVFGIAFLIMAFYKELSHVRFTALVISAIMVIRFFVIIGSTLFKNPTAVIGSLVDAVAIIIYTGLIILGATIKTKPPRPESPPASQ